MSVLRSSLYWALTWSNSSLIICILNSKLARMSFKCSINFMMSSYSALSLSCSRPVNWRNLISTMARAWISVKEKRSIKLFFASSGVLDARIIRITSSIWSLAMIKPSRIWARSSACFNSNWVRRVMTSWRCSTNNRIKSFKFNKRGLPPTSAMLFTPKEVWRAVCFNNVFSTTLAMASFFKSITIRIPLRSDSSLILEIPSIFFSFTRSAMREINSALLTI